MKVPTVVLGLVAGVLTVIAGVLAVIEELSDNAPSPQGTQITVVPNPPPTPPPDPDPEPSPAAYATRASGQISLVNGHGIDLDGTAADPSGDSIQDITITEGHLLFPRATQLLVLGSENPDHETCNEAKGYVDGDQLPAQYIRKLCLKTSEKRIAAITHIIPYSDGVTFDVTIYDPPLE